MVNPLDLLIKVLMLVLMMIPGFLMRKFKMADGITAKNIANLIIYVAQPALLIEAYMTDFSPEILKTSIWVFIFSTIVHGMCYGLSFLLFREKDEAKRKVLRFASIFANNGYMGIPLIISLFSSEAAIYASFYNIPFSIFQWSVGCLIYTGDKKYLSARKIFINPSMIPIYIGLLFFFLPINQYVPQLAMDLMINFKNLIAPLSMVMIGIRLADVDFREIFKDLSMYKLFFVKLFLNPVLIWCIMKLFVITGICKGEVGTMALTISLICASTPVATATSIFAEMFGGDSHYSGKAVAFTTVGSIITMPIVALLLLI
jgi:predicted permease